MPTNFRKVRVGDLRKKHFAEVNRLVFGVGYGRQETVFVGRVLVDGRDWLQSPQFSSIDEANMWIEHQFSRKRLSKKQWGLEKILTGPNVL